MTEHFLEPALGGVLVVAAYVPLVDESDLPYRWTTDPPHPSHRPDPPHPHERIVMKLTVIGGTGLIGPKLVAELQDHGHEVVVAVPATGVDTLTGEGLAEAFDGADVVVDVSNSPSFEPADVLAFFETSTRNILDAEQAAGVEVGGPEQFRLDELVRRTLAGRQDPREVVTDPAAPYSGAPVGERTLLPDGGALLGETRFDDWLAPQG